MYISKVKVSEEFFNPNGRHVWLGCDVVVEHGEDEKKAFQKAVASLSETNKEISETPVIQVEKSKSKMDMVMLKKYNQAIIDKDEVTIKQIESNYHVES